MLNQIAKLSLLAAATYTGLAFAADADIPTINPDEGRVGEVQQVVNDNEFRVCADPENMPYSNLKKEGFEDKIAELIANDLGKKLTYTYAYYRQGFLRNTINAMRCDVIMSTTADNDSLTTTKPYYRSGHIFVWRKDSGYNIKDWDSPDLRKGVIGVVGEGPATIPMNERGLIANARPYRMQRDLNLPPSFMIDDLGNKVIDIAVTWGPIGGYFAKQSSVPMQVAFVPESGNVKGKEYWNISMGVRKKDRARAKMLNEAIDRNQDKIAKILADYGVPTVPVVEGESVEKIFKNNAKAKAKGDAEAKTQ